MTTVTDICSRALQEINRLALNQAAPAGDLNFCFDRLNMLIDGWANEELLIFTVTRTTWPITSGTADYAVGTGQIINIPRPVSPQMIDRVNFYDSSITPINELPLNLVNDQYWEGLGMKSLTSPYPVHARYNPTYPTGLLSLWMVPTNTTLRGVIYTPTRISSFAAVTDTVSLPPGYERFMVKNLAVDIAPAFGAVVTPDMMLAARESKSMLMTSNHRIIYQNLDSATLQFGSRMRSGYNIYSDSWN